MELEEKLKILSDAAKYDASCSSSGSTRANTREGMGNASYSGICHSFTSDGRCVSLLKILLTNACIYDCKYCINRKTNDVKRAIFTPEEIASITINFYRRNYIEGLFLSSAIIKSPNYTMELLYKTLYLLRTKYKFNGYIHVKAIPGSDDNLLKKVGSLADRMSTNIELPSNESLKLLAPDKKEDKIKNTMETIKNIRSKSIVPAGQTTQLIVGVTKDSDYDILDLTEKLYNNNKLKRVYYSAYIPVNKDNLLPMIKEVPLKRENRLYQADWLLRYYNFKASDILDKNRPNFNLLLDPKADYALRHLDMFPIEINTASYNTLLKVPGIRITSAKKIISSRKFTKLNFDTLKKLGVVMKRAKYFILCNGFYYAESNLFNKNYIQKLLEEPQVLNKVNYKQLNLFEE